MSFNAGFNPFKKKSPVETSERESSTPEADIRVILDDLDAQFGKEAVDEALGRISNKVVITGEMALNIPPASDQLLKSLETIEKKFGMEQVAATLVQIETERAV